MLITNKIIGFNNATILDRFSVGDVLEVKYESRKGYWALKTFIGICIAKKNAKEKTKIILRNVINNVSVEYNLYIYSSDIVEIKKLDKQKYIKLGRSKLFFLRRKSLNQSKV